MTACLERIRTAHDRRISSIASLPVSFACSLSVCSLRSLSVCSLCSLSVYSASPAVFYHSPSSTMLMSFLLHYLHFLTAVSSILLPCPCRLYSITRRFLSAYYLLRDFIETLSPFSPPHRFRSFLFLSFPFSLSWKKPLSPPCLPCSLHFPSMCKLVRGAHTFNTRRDFVGSSNIYKQHWVIGRM